MGRPTGHNKARGAYYTAEAVSDFLVAWAVRSADDKVLDPSFGAGVFLDSACRRLCQLGGEPKRQVFGVELDRAVHAEVLDRLHGRFGLGPESLLRSDFFALASSVRRVDAVVGNPPFIRYQRFTGAVRRRALACARQEGVELSELTSAWAPFLVHAATMVRGGGRMAMVVPNELTYATYARPLIRYLARQFGSVTLLTFQRSLFPHLSERTMLLLAKDKGQSSAEFKWRDLAGPEELAAFCSSGGFVHIAHAATVDPAKLCRSEVRLVAYHLPKAVRELYAELREHPRVAALGQAAAVGIGYVSGANDYFHFSPQEAERRRIPASFLVPAVRRGRAFGGIRFTRADWHAGLASENTGYLLAIPPLAELPCQVRRYIAEGERGGVSQAYKCRVREPWYSVPHVRTPDAFLTYMSGTGPKLVANAAGAVAPNTLHVVRIRRGVGVCADQLAASSLTALTRLSAEIQGHALGGGMLKLEPGEAKNVLLALPGDALDEALLADLEESLRTVGADAAGQIADDRLLKGALGLTEKDCRSLRAAAEMLLRRRCEKRRRTG